MRNKKLIALICVFMSLIVVIVACCATFLVRDISAYSYYNIENDGIPATDAAVVSASGIEKNSSMFFIDEDEVKARIERELPYIRVINVQRSFPDRVRINYVYHEKLFRYDAEGKTYLCYSSGRIAEAFLPADKQPTEYFRVVLKQTPSTAVGEYFEGADSYDRKLIDAYIKFMYSKQRYDKNINEFTEFIDLSRDGYVYIRTKAGCSIEVSINNVNEFAEIFEAAWNYYSDTSVELEHGSGLIKAYKRRAGTIAKVRATYTKVGEMLDNTPYYDDAYYAEHYSSASPRN